MNRLYFGRKLGHKALEFVSTFNPVRLPISAGPEAFKFGADGKSPSLGYQKFRFRLFVSLSDIVVYPKFSLIDLCLHNEFRPPKGSFFCDRLEKDTVKLPLKLQAKCHQLMRFLTRESLCDGFRDCEDGNDEDTDFCQTFDCGQSRWKCFKGPSFQCIDKNSGNDETS